jgi:hypothetical protein
MPGGRQAIEEQTFPENVGNCFSRKAYTFHYTSKKDGCKWTY